MRRPLFSLLAFAIAGLLSSVATSRSPAAEDAPAAEDLVPHSPLPQKKPPPPGADWAQWNDIERFRGVYEGRRGSWSESKGSSSYHLQYARAQFVLENDHVTDGLSVPAHWALTGQVIGTDHAASNTDNLFYHGHNTTDGSFASPPLAFQFNLNAKAGTWSFVVDGRTAQPYTLTFVRKAEYMESGAGYWVDDSRTSVSQTTYYPHGGGYGVLPVGRPEPLHGGFDKTEDHTTGMVRKGSEDYARFILAPEYKDLELVVEIEGVTANGGTVPYEKWIPRGTPGGAAGSRLKVKARLQTEDGGAVTAGVDYFVFELVGTSREPGVCLNFPLNATPAAGKQAAPDLKFAPMGACDADRQKLAMPPATDDSAHPHAEARIDCFDFGAWSALWVTAELTDGRSITGHLKGDPSNLMMSLPKRSGGSRIADAWKEARGITAGDEDDSEKLPLAGKVPGDGFTLYEEYRGFVENGIHLEGDPKKIDFFVRNYIGGDARPGIDLFTRLTGAEVHDRLRDAEFDAEKRVMNANHDRGPHRVDQHGVYLRTQAGLDGAAAIFIPGGVRGRPRLCQEIVVQPRGAATSVTTSENVPVSDLVFAYDRAIAHELLHAVGVEHHGDSDYSSTFHLIFADDPRNKSGKPMFSTGFATSQVAVSIKDERTGRDLAEMLAPDLMLAREHDRAKGGMNHSKEVTKGWWDGHRGANAVATTYSEDETTEILYNDVFGCFRWYVGAQHGECSGDENCVSRYYFAKLYQKQGVARAYYYISDRQTERAGLGLCRSCAGTGINGSGHSPRPRYGDTYSGWGECARWIVFCDAAPDEPAPTPPPPKR